ncbi:hypothetical protein GIR22_13125 [Pseudomonas sp. CCM 7891]|uniref:Uncharacterized protein n=1 Tax=Pseudomonas karstica TaxID=1055468 RepID=A0A7X2RU98_9PSED|nr:hypothetical protein [Pseudomonas karstica]MTD20062.1 hypothetical protein [Pseudomonas karstica]
MKWNIAPYMPAPISTFEHRHSEKPETKGRPGSFPGVQHNTQNVQGDSDVWRSPLQLIDRNRPGLGMRYQPSSLSPSTHSLPIQPPFLAFLNQITPDELGTFQKLQGRRPETVDEQNVANKFDRLARGGVEDVRPVRVDYTPKAANKASSMGKLLATAMETITSRDQQIFEMLDGRRPKTKEELSAVEKFEIIEKELQKTLTKHPSEYTHQTIPIETTDLEQILLHEGFPTRRESDVICKLYEGGTLTLEEQIIALKINLLGY